jgi:hypothetical protein
MPIGGGYGGGSGFGSGFNPGGMLGGGFNGGLGGFGNYGGGLMNPGFGGGFGYSGYGGRSNGINFALDYQPWPNTTLGININRALSEGDYQFNSSRSDLGITASYNMGERLTFTGMMNMQNVSYIGMDGGSKTRLMFLSLHGKPFGRLGAQLSYQLMNTDSNFNAGTGGAPGTGGIGGLPGYGGGFGYGFGSGSTNLKSYSMRFEYPIWKGNNLFFQMDNSDSSGYFSALQRTMIVGIDFPITPILAFQLGLRDQQNISRGDTSGIGDYSYRVRSLDANLHMRVH